MSAVVLGCVPGIVTGLLSEGLFRYAATRYETAYNKYKVDVTDLVKIWKTSVGSGVEEIPDYSDEDPSKWLLCPHKIEWVLYRPKNECSADQQIKDCHTLRARVYNLSDEFDKNQAILQAKHLLSLLVLTVGTIALSILFAPAALARTSYSYYGYIALSVASSSIGAMIPMLGTRV